MGTPSYRDEIPVRPDFYSKRPEHVDTRPRRGNWGVRFVQGDESHSLSLTRKFWTETDETQMNGAIPANGFVSSAAFCFCLLTVTVSTFMTFLF